MPSGPGQIAAAAGELAGAHEGLAELEVGFGMVRVGRDRLLQVEEGLEGVALAPEGLGLAATAPLLVRSNLQEIAKLLAGIGADRIAASGGGADIGPIMREGVTGANLDVDGSRYFDIHHTESDTLDKIDPRDLSLCVATMAVMAYTIADMPGPLNGSAN